LTPFDLADRYVVKTSVPRWCALFAEL